MIAQLRRVFGIRREITLDVILRDLLELVVFRIRDCAEDGKQQRERSSNDDSHTASAGRAAVKNRLGGDFIRRKLRLEISPTFIKTGHNHKDNSGAKHQPGEERKVLISAELVSCDQDPFIDQTDEKLT